MTDAEKKERDTYIQNIQGLYPADSEYSASREIGKELLFEAICSMWRSLPTGILREYSDLCNYRERCQ